MATPENSSHPLWMNESLFKDYVSQEYPTGRIASFSVQHASGNGENFASVLYKIKMAIEIEKSDQVLRSFMIKVNHESGFGVQMAKMLQLFPKEIKMYKELLPTFEGYFEAIGENLRIGPKCIMAECDPLEMIIMEDISVDGYKTADRTAGLDMEHVQLVLDKLAKYHAASAYHFENNGDYGALFKNGMVNEDLQGKRDMSGHYEMLRDFLKDLKCAPLLNKLFDNHKTLIEGNSQKAVKRRDDRFNVLCHGDMWSNNIMFQYNKETGKPEACMLVDFQMCFYSSPMLDLHYFIINSLSRSNKITQVDYIIHLYHENLVKNLKALGYQGHIPTLLELQRDFLDTGAFGLFSAVLVFPVIKAPASDDSTIDNITSETADSLEMKRCMYTNKTFTDGLEDLIPYFHRKGYLEL